jgi:undecaprenyl-diphosphatase
VTTRGERRFLTRAVILFAIAVVATVAFAAIAEEVLEGEADATDVRVALAIRGHHGAALTAILRVATHAGSDWFLVPLVIASAGWALLRGRRWIAAILVAHALVAWGVNILIKVLVARPRPGLFHEIVVPPTYSFPSGHAMVSCAIYGALAAVVIQLAPRRRVPVVAATALLVLTIGFSRVYLGVHWPSDVVAGFAAAVPLLAVTLHLLHRVAPRAA